MNPVLLIAYNNLNMTAATVESVLAQDIPVELYLVNNGSTDRTRGWGLELEHSLPNVHFFHHETNLSPIKLGNMYAQIIFDRSDYLLGVPNDVRLPSNCYSEMLKWPRGFVCASDNGHAEPVVRPATAVSENTPMAVMLVRKWAHDAIKGHSGYLFDEGFTHYASDCDLALRMAACGIRGVQLDIPFWHYGSATWRLASETEQRAMLQQADMDRAYFERKWGFRVDALEYGQRAGDVNFRGTSSANTP